MRLTVLGRYGPYPAPGGACSSYLLETKGVKLLLDLGSGTLSRLLSICPLEEIDAILLSHLHSDHMADMLILRYALQQMHAAGKRVPYPMTVVCPAEPEAEFRMLTGSGTFNVIRAEDGLKLRFAPLTVVLHQVLHPVPSFAMRITEDSPKTKPQYGVQPLEKSLFYTGDTGLIPSLSSLCEEAAMLLADTCFLSRDKTTEFAPHLTALEAGALAKRAGVGRLLCTHVWGGGHMDADILYEARQMFPDAQVAQEMASYEI